jgi:hypothetical protein
LATAGVERVGLNTFRREARSIRSMTSINKLCIHKG